MADLRGFGAEVAAAIESGDYAPWDCPEEQQDWRWSVLRQVLLHPDTGVVSSREESVRFGLALFGSEDGNLRGETCPVVDAGSDGVAVSFGASSALLNRMGCGDLRGDTPTRESLTRVAAELAGTESEGPKVVVLVMAGEPDSCDCPDWTSGGVAAALSLPDECIDDGRELGDDKEVNYRPGPAGTGARLKPSAYERELLMLEAARVRAELGVFVEVINLSFPEQLELRDTADAIAVAGDASQGASLLAFDPKSLREALEQIVDAHLACEMK